MDVTGQGLLATIVVGIVAGFLAGQVVRGFGFGLLGDLVVGIVGAFVGNWLLPQLHVHLGTGLVASIANAFIGAVVLLLVLGLVMGAGRRRRF